MVTAKAWQPTPKQKEEEQKETDKEEDREEALPVRGPAPRSISRGIPCPDGDRGRRAGARGPKARSEVQAQSPFRSAPELSPM